jgi:DNA-binding beta-propeller fold protein YncE
MRLGKLTATLILAGVVAGCGGSSPSVTVSIAPITPTVILTNTQQFGSAVTGTQNTAVTWEVCNPVSPTDATGTSGSTITLPTGCVTGSATLGNITTLGLYTAPATLPNPPTVSIVATSQQVTTVFAVVNVNLDSGVRVSVTPSQATIGTNEQFEFTSTVTGTANDAVVWSVNGIAGGSTSNPDVGTIAPGACTATQPIAPPDPNVILNGPGTSVACYFAPVVPQSGSVAIAANSVVDTRQSGSSNVSVLGATDPSLNALAPTITAVEGSVRQDIYLTGSNFFSTSLVLVNGTLVPSLFLDGSDIRAIIPGSFLTNSPPGPLSITVQRQNGGTAQPVSLPVIPTRPAVVSSSPDSIPLNSPSGTVNLIGGYFSPSSVASLQGTSRSANLVNSRQLNVTLTNTDLSTPGLFPILIQNTDNTASGAPFFASANLSVPPATSSIPLAPVNTVTVGTQPVAVAIDSALGTAVVVNQGTAGNPGSVSLINLDANPPVVTATPSVGVMPTSVGVDDLLHLAAVVNSADNTLSIVNLQTQSLTSTFPLPANPTGILPAPSSPTPPPYSIGVNPITHRALVAYSSSNIATVVDLSTTPPTLVCILGGSNPSMANNCARVPQTNTRPVSTGVFPAVAVEPQLNWAVVTPGGAGSITLVDLGTNATATQVARTPNAVATLAPLSGNIRGVAINPETHQAVFADPTQANLVLFSVLDQTVNQASSNTNNVADAVNPLTNIAVAVNRPANAATIEDLQSRQQIASVNVGNSPVAVAVDPGKNEAVVVNQADGTASILSLGPITTPQITEISSATAFNTSSGSFTLTISGFGFASNAQVRLDGSATGITTLVSSSGRQATATIPASYLGSPRRYSLDVMNPGGNSSNEMGFTVIGAVPLGQNPIGVAIDPTLNQALVTIQGTINPSTGACTSPGTVSIVNLATATVANTLPVGTCPEDVAVSPRLGRAVVANNGSGDATVLDYVNDVVVSTISLGNNSSPMGVAIQQDTSNAAVANFGNNTVSVFNITGSVGASTSTIPVDPGPIAVSVDPDDNLMAVAAAAETSAGQTGTLDIVSLGTHFINGRVPNFQNPSDISFDPITENFLVANSLANDLAVVDPVTFKAVPVSTGINPTSVAYNFQTSTAVTVNGATNTMSVISFLARNDQGTLTFTGAQVREILPMGGSNEFSVAIDPATNLAAVVDQANGRLLLVPLPR